MAPRKRSRRPSGRKTATRKPSRKAAARKTAARGRKPAARKARKPAAAKRRAPRSRAAAPAGAIGMMVQHLDYTSQSMDEIKRFYTELLG